MFLIGLSLPLNIGDSIGHNKRGKEMKRETYVLVHSAWLGAWSWGNVKNELESKGHNVAVLDLPAHGEDKTPAKDVTMNSYVKAVQDVIDGQDGKVILVGHSFGGMVISQVAETRSDKIKSLVYLTAMLTPNGVSFLDATAPVKNSVALNNLVFSEDQTYVTVKEDKLHEAFGADIPIDTFTSTLPLLSAEPTAPLGSKLELTDENFGSIPRFYIQTLNDNAIPTEVQQAMFTSMGIDKLYTINDSSHLPIFSHAGTVANILDEISQENGASITNEQKANVLNEVLSTSSKWKEAFNSGNGAGCAAQYEADAVMEAKPFGTFTGTKDIQAFWENLVNDGFADVTYINAKVGIIDENSAVLESGWSMNKAGGIITKELFVRQNDGSFKLHEDHFEAAS